MKLETKANMGGVVYYLKDNKIYSSKVLEINILTRRTKTPDLNYN